MFKAWFQPVGAERWCQNLHDSKILCMPCRQGTVSLHLYGCPSKLCQGGADYLVHPADWGYQLSAGLCRTWRRPYAWAVIDQSPLIYSDQRTLIYSWSIPLRKPFSLQNRWRRAWPRESHSQDTKAHPWWRGGSRHTCLRWRCLAHPRWTSAWQCWWS